MAEVAVMHAQWQAQLQAATGVTTSPETAPASQDSGEAASSQDVITKMGGNFKKKTAGLASKAASSVIEGSFTNEKDKGNSKKAAKLEGKAAEAALEAGKIAGKVEEAMQ